MSAVLAPPRASVAVVEDLADTVWDVYVWAHPSASVYHQAAWPRLIARVFGREVRLLAAVREGRVTGVLPLVRFRSRVFGSFAVSLPFVNYGGVLASDGDSERALLGAAIAVGREWGASHIELRHVRQHFPELRPRRHKVAMTLPLAVTPDAQWSGLDRKLRNQVRKAEKSGITVTAGGMENLEAFYEVFSTCMRDLGTPVYPKAFFREMLAAFPDRTHIFTARHDGVPVAAAVTQTFRSTFEVPSAGSLKAFRPLCPNILMYWEMVRFAIGAGMEVFDFGRSTRDEGTFHFKRQWGAEPHELAWEYWLAAGAPVPDLSPGNPRYARAIALWRRLPVTAANALGPRIVRNIP